MRLRRWGGGRCGVDRNATALGDVFAADTCGDAMRLLRALGNRPISAVVLVASAVGLIVFLMWAQGGMLWTGRTELEIVFEAIDGTNGKPIPSAVFAIETRDDLFCRCGDEKEFVLITDHDGLARKHCPYCRCGGYDSAFSNTWSTNVPAWTFTAFADGYKSSEPELLGNYSRLATRPRLGERVAHLKVTVKLTKGKPRQ